MTLDEAIKHAEEVAEGQLMRAGRCTQDDTDCDKYSNCIKCAEEHRQLAEWLRDYKRLLEQEPCEDAISRSGAIKAIEERAKRIKNEDTLNGLAGAVGALFDLPSVKPQEKTGHWIKMPLIEAGQSYSHECSECGRKILAMNENLSEFLYCHCGARMEGSNNK